MHRQQIESPPGSDGAGPPIEPSGPPRTPRGTRLDRLGLDGDELLSADKARADVAAKVAKNEWYLGDGAEGRTHLERLQKTHLRMQKIYIAQIEGQGGFSYATIGTINDLINANQMIEALSILLRR